jgi:hypothetical protein
MLIERVTGLISVRRCMVALHAGDAMSKPPLGGVAFGFATGCPFPGDP